MEHPNWTVEIAEGTASPSGLEEYELRSADDRHVGLVTSVVDYQGSVFLLANVSSMPPFTHSWRAFGWDDVAGVDHDALVVRLAADAARLDAIALAFDGRQVVHGGAADAVRVAALPGRRLPWFVPGTAGPVQGPSWLLAAAAVGASALSLFVIVLLLSIHRLHGFGYAAFAVPVLLAGLAVGLLGYTLYGEPHKGHRALHHP